MVGAGDGDGDGAPSMAWGAPDYGVTPAWTGLVTELDAQDGTPLTEEWSVDGGVSFAALGISLAGGGDIDGDGFSDLAAGRPNASTGGVVVWAGNRADADHVALWGARPRALDSGTGDTIPPGGRSEGQEGFDLSVHSGAPYARTRATLEWEVKATGVPFDDADLVFDSTAWTEVACTLCIFDPVRELTAQVTGLDPDTPYHWRARVRYDPAQARPMLWSRWYYGGREADPDGVHVRTALADADGDGFPELGDPPDCDDDDPAVYPGAPELCDGLDTDCDGEPDNTFDIDEDGITTCGPDGVPGTADDDCDDDDPDAFPSATEVCDGDLEDCDATAIDDGFDGDGDGVTTCGSDGLDGTADDDCDDDDPGAFPGAAEICDGVDQDCDGTVADEFSDLDGDDIPDCEDDDVDGDGDTAETDCDDEDPTRYTGADEACDEIDSDCDGSFIDGFPNTDNNPDAADLPDCADEDDDDDGTPDSEDCEPLLESIHPGAAELCDSIDSDCDGSLLDGPTGEDDFGDLDEDGEPDCVDPDADGDGHANPGNEGGDCDDLDAAVYPQAEEICDAKDSDCDGDIPAVEEDVDEDGWPICADDCDDQDATTNPGAEEIAGNGKDDDCDGVSESLEGGGAAAPGCSCDGDAPASALLLVLALPFRRRRRRDPWRLSRR